MITKLTFVLIMISTLFMMMKHPLSMALILLTNTTIIAMIGGLMNSSFWYSYMLFMIMIGGLLVLVMYMTSIASNEKFKFNMKATIMIMIMTGIMLASKELTIMETSLSTNETMIMFNKNFQLTLSKFINQPMYMIIIMMINYLLITMIAIVKITNMKYGSLRQKF